jgi:hypothetical protein
MEISKMLSLRRQHTNVKNYNIVALITSKMGDLIKKISNIVPYDIFTECVKALTELVDGPNLENQQILVDNEFVELAEQLLDLTYHRLKGGEKEGKGLARLDTMGLEENQNYLRFGTMNSMESMNMSVSNAQNS